eukprot:9215296-Pyramimonas_sp.AAC.1
MHKYFQPEHKRGCGTNYEKEEEFGISRGMEEVREPKRRRMEEEENLRLSKRIALSYMRETVWEFTTPGLPVEICGDSLLIVSWINGVWACEQ